MNNINIEIFKRYQPKKKLEMIEALNTNELLNITSATITRIIKEAGENKYKSRNKELRLSNTYRTGNNWNSTIVGWGLYKGKVCVNFYIQYNNTDTENTDTIEKFIKRGDYRGALTTTDQYGNPHSHYYIYDEADKAKAIRSLLYQYVHTKYSDKLKNDEN